MDDMYFSLGNGVTAGRPRDIDPSRKRVICKHCGRVIVVPKIKNGKALCPYCGKGIK